ncbi:hypothetical protein EYF80_032115 [Liparis tanakae]|uniref:Uncharacterized protein n=1 Tax=Liparis tanakae TaxID=230148 RepID=A0A4Z2GY05_9TELE|nr:hypothetical protein EYF80_032115 [Liparis tanakae]
MERLKRRGNGKGIVSSHASSSRKTQRKTLMFRRERKSSVGYLRIENAEAIAEDYWQCCECSGGRLQPNEEEEEMKGAVLQVAKGRRERHRDSIEPQIGRAIIAASKIQMTTMAVTPMAVNDRNKENVANQTECPEGADIKTEFDSTLKREL